MLAWPLTEPSARRALPPACNWCPGLWKVANESSAKKKAGQSDDGSFRDLERYETSYQADYPLLIHKDIFGYNTAHFYLCCGNIGRKMPFQSDQEQAGEAESWAADTFGSEYLDVDQSLHH